jgi:hypothetical protein
MLFPGINMAKAPSKIQLVRQRSPLDCGIATAAMIAGVTYEEAWKALAPPPGTPATYIAYHERETRFLNEIGWWAASQIVLTTVIGLGHLRHLIDEDANIKSAFEQSQRMRLVVEFSRVRPGGHPMFVGRFCRRAPSPRTWRAHPNPGILPSSERMTGKPRETPSW